MNRPILVVSFLVFFALLFSGAQADETDTPEQTHIVRVTLDVTAEAPQVPAVSTLDRETLEQVGPLGDGAEVLRGTAGVSLGRMGGHGLEPTIRGLAQTNVNVLLDGAQIHGGCPNRMDPPTSFGAAEDLDEVVVIKGLQSLRFGSGGNAGTILFNRSTPRFDSDHWWRANVGAGYGSFLESPELALDASVGSSNFSMRLLGSSKSLDNYEDGDGNEIRSAFDSQAATLMLGWTPDDRTAIEFSADVIDTSDALFAGAGMDAPLDQAAIYRLEARQEPTPVNAISWYSEVFFSDVDHEMDNFSLRPLTAPSALRVPSSSSTTGGRLITEFGDQWRFSLGVDALQIKRQASRFAGPTPELQPVLQSVMWADIETLQAGVLAEAVHEFRPATHLHLGVRVDHLSSDARDADHKTMGGGGPSPSALWAMYYDQTGDSWDDTVISALARVEHDTGAVKVFAGISRSIRQPDATERYLASNSPMPTMRWVGNPGLEAARHHQLDLGLVWANPKYSLSLTAFGDWTDNLIIRDRAHLQSGVLKDDSASIYRNVDGRRLGIEAEGHLLLDHGFFVTATASWVQGDNRTDNRPLAQTPPLEGRLVGGWTSGRWSVTTVMRWAARQTRVDDDPQTGSGLDFGQTPGWAVLDLWGSVDLCETLSFQVGFANVFDRTYAVHLNRTNLFDPSPTQVNEPGQSIWARVRWHSGG